MRAVSGGKFFKDTALFNDDEYLCVCVVNHHIDINNQDSGRQPTTGRWHRWQPVG